MADGGVVDFKMFCNLVHFVSIFFVGQFDIFLSVDEGFQTGAIWNCADKAKACELVVKDHA